MAGISSISQALGFATQGRIAWGTYEGYRFGITVVSAQRGPLHICTAAHFSNDADKGAVTALLEDMRANKDILSFSTTAHGYDLVLEPGIVGYKTERIAGVMHKLADALRQQGAQPCCHNCGSGEGLAFADLNSDVLSLCAGCHSHIEDALRRKEDSDALLPNNYALGIVGAVVGALLGGAIWVGIGLLGYLAAIASAAIAFFAVKGYLLLKGKLTRTAVVFICLICLAVFILAQFITMDIMLIKELIANGYDPDYGQILLATFQIPFSDSELTEAFMRDSLMGLVFLVLGSWGTLRAVGRQAAKPAGELVRLPG